MARAFRPRTACGMETRLPSAPRRLCISSGRWTAPRPKADAALTTKDDGGEKVHAPADLPLTHDALIGLERGRVDLVLDHLRVSRRHAQCGGERRPVSLRDLGGSNGTF